MNAMGLLNYIETTVFFLPIVSMFFDTTGRKKSTFDTIETVVSAHSSLFPMFLFWGLAIYFSTTSTSSMVAFLYS